MFRHFLRCLLFPLLVVASSSARPPVKTLIVFGDSYSDDCNFWRLSNSPETVAPFPFPNCPSPPTGRADNGLAWPETIRNISDIRVINLAFSGATCNVQQCCLVATLQINMPTPVKNTEFPQTYEESYNGTVVDLDVTSQIQKYVALDDPSMKTPEQTVAAIFIGTNDLGFFFKALRKNRTPNSLPTGVQITNEAACIVKQVQTLYGIGIRRFLIFETIPLQDVAEYSADIVNGVSQPGVFFSIFMTQLVSANNALKALQLDSLQNSLPGSDIQIFPTFDFYAQRFANPKAFLGQSGTSAGFCNTNTGPCTNPQDFLFWDELHPGLVANNQLAAAVVAFLDGLTDVTGPEMRLITQSHI